MCQRILLAILIVSLAEHFRGVTAENVYITYATRNQRVHRTIPLSYPLPLLLDGARLRRQSGYNYDKPSISFDLPNNKGSPPSPDKTDAPTQNGYPKADRTPSKPSDSNLYEAPKNDNNPMRQIPSGGYPQNEGNNNGPVAESGYPKNTPPSGFPQDFPSQGYPKDNPQSPASSGFPQDVPSRGYPKDIPQTSAPNGYPQDVPSQGYPKDIPRSPAPDGYPKEAPQVAEVARPAPTYSADLGAPADPIGSTPGTPYLPPKLPSNSYEPNEVNMVIVVPDIPQNLDSSTSGPEYLPPFGSKPDTSYSPPAGPPSIASNYAPPSIGSIYVPPSVNPPNPPKVNSPSPPKVNPPSPPKVNPSPNNQYVPPAATSPTAKYIPPASNPRPVPTPFAPASTYLPPFQ